MMGSTNGNQHEIFENFRVACDKCEKMMDWERAQILPGKILCKRCLAISCFSRWFFRVLIATEYIKRKNPSKSDGKKILQQLFNSGSSGSCVNGKKINAENMAINTLFDIEASNLKK